MGRQLFGYRILFFTLAHKVRQKGWRCCFSHSVRRTHLGRVVVAASDHSVVPEVQPGSVVESAVTSVAAVHAACQQFGCTQLGGERRSTGDTQAVCEGSCR